MVKRSYESLYGKTDETAKEDRIKWVLRLLEMNLDQLSPAEREDIEEGCLWFRAPNLNVDNLKKFLPIVREGLEEFVPKNIEAPSRNPKNKNKGIEILPQIGEMRLPIDGGVLSLLKLDDSGKIMLLRLFMSTTQSMFFEDIISALETCGTQLFRCKKCQKIYFKVKRQEYCSKTCSDKTRSHDYYAKHAKEVRAKRKKTYAEGIEKSLGAKVKDRKPKSD